MVRATRTPSRPPERIFHSQRSPPTPAKSTGAASPAPFDLPFPFEAAAAVADYPFGCRHVTAPTPRLRSHLSPFSGPAPPMHLPKNNYRKKNIYYAPPLPFIILTPGRCPRPPPPIMPAIPCPPMPALMGPPLPSPTPWLGAPCFSLCGGDRKQGSCKER